MESTAAGATRQPCALHAGNRDAESERNRRAHIAMQHRGMSRQRNAKLLAQPKDR